MPRPSPRPKLGYCWRDHAGQRPVPAGHHPLRRSLLGTRRRRLRELQSSVRADCGCSRSGSPSGPTRRAEGVRFSV